MGSGANLENVRYSDSGVSMVGRFESTPFAGETAAAANGVESTAGVARTALR